MFKSKGSYAYGQSRNVFLSSVQKSHLPVQDCKRPRLMQASIGPRMEICENPTLPLAMVPCLHQRNVYIKRKLRVSRLKKCILLVSAKTSLTCAGLQTSPSHVRQYTAENEYLRISGSTFPMVPCLHQSNVYIKRKLRLWTVQKCIPIVGAKTSLTRAGLLTTPSHVSQQRAKNGNLRKSGSTFSHGIVFAPKQCLYQKKATGMESPKMYSFCRYKSLIFLCGTANDPASCKPVYSRDRKFAEIRVSLFSHGTVFAPKQCLHQNKATGMESPIMYSFRRYKSLTLLCGTANDPTSCKPVYSRDRKFAEIRVSLFSHGTVFAPKHCLYQNKATGMESPKMYFFRRYKSLTLLCGTANDPTSCKPV